MHPPIAKEEMPARIVGAARSQGYFSRRPRLLRNRHRGWKVPCHQRRDGSETSCPVRCSAGSVSLSSSVDPRSSTCRSRVGLDRTSDDPTLLPVEAGFARKSRPDEAGCPVDTRPGRRPERQRGGRGGCRLDRRSPIRARAPRVAAESRPPPQGRPRPDLSTAKSGRRDPRRDRYRRGAQRLLSFAAWQASSIRGGPARR